MGVNKNKLIRVANIIEESKLGGPQIRLSTVAAELSDRVHTTVLLPSENSFEFRRLLDLNNISYRLFWMSRITKQFSVAVRYVIFFPYEVIRLALHLRRNRYDLVHVSGGAWQYKGVLAAKLSNVPVVWHLNDTYMPKLIRYVFQMISPLVSGYICSSYRTYDYYQQYIDREKKFSVIHPPVDVRYYDIESQNEEISAAANNLIIGTVCNINPIKNIELLIKAVNLLNKQCQYILPFTVQILGPTNKNQQGYYLQLLSLMESMGVANVYFLGGKKDIRPFLRTIDIYVCSSLSESGPMSLFEAMAMKKAVVSTDVGDVGKFINNGVSGYVVESNNHVQLAERLLHLMTNKTLRIQLGEQAVLIAKNNLSLQSCAEKHDKIYREILQQNEVVSNVR